MKLREPAGVRTDLGHAREITHHALDLLVPLPILWWPWVAARTTVHSGSV